MYLLGFYVSPAVIVSVFLIGLLSFFMKLKSKKYNLPPGPWPLPVVGNLPWIVKEPNSLIAFTKLRIKYGPIYILHLGIQNIVMVNNAELAIEALVKKQVDFAGRPSIPSFNRASEGRMNVANESFTPHWHMRRKVAFKALKSALSGPNLTEKVTLSIDKALGYMSKVKGPFDPHKYIDLILYNIIADICHGTRYELDDPDFTKIVDFNNDFQVLFGNGFISDFVPWMRIFETSAIRKIDAYFKMLRTDAQSSIDRHRETFDPNNPRNFTDYLLLAKHKAQEEGDTVLLNELTDVHLRQTMLNVITAGTFTSSMTIAWLILMVIRNPNVQIKIHNEIDSVLGHKKMNAEMSVNFPYCRAVIQEVLRKCPVVPFGIPRATICDTTLGGYDIPKGTQVVFNLWDLHHDPQKWDNPSEFNPERFLEESGKLAGKPASFLPFMAGRRVCLGEIFSRPEMLIIVVSIFQRFHISSPPGEIPPVEGAISAAGYMSPPYNILLEERY